MHAPADDPRRDAARLRSWLQRAGFAPGEPTSTGEARWLRPPGDAWPGLPGQATEVRLSRGAGGDLEIGFFDDSGAPVSVDDRAFAPVGPLTDFVDRHCRTGPAAALVRAGRAWRDHTARGGWVLVSLGDGASAAAGLGLAALIRRGAVHAVVCGGGELEAALSALMAPDGGSACDAAELTGLFEPLWAAIADGRAPLSPAEACAEALRLLFAEQPHLRARRRDAWICAALDAGVPVWAPDWGDGVIDRALAAWCAARGVARSRVLPGRAEAVKALAGAIRRPEDVGCVWLGAGQGLVAEAAGWIDASASAPWAWTCRIAPDAPAATFTIASDPSLAAPLLFGYVLDA